jgi:hypothetical protein
MGKEFAVIVLPLRAKTASGLNDDDHFMLAASRQLLKATLKKMYCSKNMSEANPFHPGTIHFYNDKMWERSASIAYDGFRSSVWPIVLEQIDIYLKGVQT